MLFNRVILQVAAAAVAGPLFQSVAPLQAFDPSVVFDAPAPTRAVGAFLASVVFGGLVIYRYGDRLTAAVEASTESPILSVLYGFIAYGLVSFLVVYAYSQLAGFGVGVSLITVAGAVVLGGALLSLGGLGFVIVGSWLANAAGVQDPWIGLLGVALGASIAVLVLPVVFGALVWFGVAAVGIGGPVRRWIHADKAERRAEEH
ncbi:MULTISPECIES: hypothetical protein [Halobellus]|uniref:hypothetical protein n=1 Tax=Halobellus TaxID=1073986 RepID=UPI00210E608B|nr:MULTISPECIES: hypothetical protein [Halobellus]MDQ2056232.1 hypothetical protein [Halobellus sp. H-GB7]